jgi:hypothetical protein
MDPDSPGCPAIGLARCVERSEGNFPAFRQGYVVLARCTCILQVRTPRNWVAPSFCGLFVRSSATAERERKNLSFATCFLAVVRRCASVAPNQAFAKTGDRRLQAMAESQT